VGGFVSDGDDRRHIDAHRTHPASKITKTEPVVFDDDLLDADAESELSDEACASLADEWVESRREIYAEHTHARKAHGGHSSATATDATPEQKSDLLFFPTHPAHRRAHVPLLLPETGVPGEGPVRQELRRASRQRAQSQL
jgi:hypothetical protein